VGAAIRWVRGNRYDVVIDLFCNPRTAILTGLSGAPLRVGYDWGARRIAYNVRVPRFGNPPGEHRYARDAMLDFLRDAGVRWEGTVTGGVHLEASDHAFAARALAELGYAGEARFAAVLPGGSWESKRWPAAGFAEVGRALAEELGAPTLVVWGPPEREDALAIAGSLAERGRLAPPSSLLEMAALLGRATLVVVTDCLGRHLAVLEGVPTVGIFGTTDPRDWTPRGRGHRTVRAPGAGQRPLAELPPVAVLTEARALLAEILDAPRPGS
jgi:heptosyltransferase-3